MTDTRPTTSRRAVPSVAVSDDVGSGRGFRPAVRRRNRISLGVLLAAVAIGGNAWVYSSLDDAEPVVQVVVDVPAGAEITTDMLRTVDVDSDPSVNVVSGEDLSSLVGSYARVRLVSGSLVTAESVQADPLVSEGGAVVAISVPEGSLPIGLRERAPVLLVIPAAGTPTETSTPTSIDGRVVGLPTTTGSALGLQSVSIEVARADAATVAAADDVRVVLVEPTADPASDEEAGDS